MTCDLNCFECIYKDCIRPLEQDNRDKNKLYYQRHRESELERYKRIYKAKREEILKRKREYYKKNKKKILKQQKQYRKENKNNKNKSIQLA